jgi:hypothetical protein
MNICSVSILYFIIQALSFHIETDTVGQVNCKTGQLVLYSAEIRIHEYPLRSPVLFFQLIRIINSEKKKIKMEH